MSPLYSFKLTRLITSFTFPLSPARERGVPEVLQVKYCPFPFIKINSNLMLEKKKEEIYFN